MESTAAAPAVSAPPIPEAKLIPIDQLKPNPWNRAIFDPAALKELAGSIKAVGVLEPLVVRPMDGGYEIASGNRRWLAAREAGVKELPCVVKELADGDIQDMNLVANIAREGVPVLEQARM